MCPAPTLQSSPPNRRAVLVGLRPTEEELVSGAGGREEYEASCRELRRLLRSLEIECATQVTLPAAPGDLGEAVRAALGGSLVSAREGAVAERAFQPLVVFDGQLSPEQEVSLGVALDADVIDRTEVILRVLERRATSQTAQLEVELARLNQRAPRARVSSRPEASKEGAGSRHLNLEQHRIRLRMAEIRRTLSERQSQQLESSACLALVGYTNCGKSSLMRALCQGPRPTAEALGAERSWLAGEPNGVQVADTIGLIRNLPQPLLAPFRSTLEQALDANLILQVVDASDPEWRSQMRVTRTLLEQVGAAQRPLQLVFNKADKVDQAALEAISEEFPQASCISAYRANDIGDLQQQLQAFFGTKVAEATFEVPFVSDKLLGEFRNKAKVLAYHYTELGTVVRVRGTPHQLEAWRQALVHGHPPAP